jgi:uncharacterized membrane protein
MPETRLGAAASPTGVKMAVRRAFLTGFAITIPLFVTLLVLGVVINSLSNVLDPVVAFTFELTGSSLRAEETPAYLLKLLAVAVLPCSVFGIGVVAERRSGSGRIEAVFDATMQRIPGVGSLYTSFDEMSEMLLNSDTQSFREVVLVEHPTPDSYTVAFVTADTPEAIERATDTDEMLTVFMPMAPNPVMGGHVVHIPSNRVYDVDMTVEEGVRSIVTSGVAIGEGGGTAIGRGGSEPATQYPPQSGFGPNGADREPTPRSRTLDRESAYDAAIDPEQADTPASVASQRADRTVGDAADRPADIDEGDGILGDDTDRPADFEQSEESVGTDTATPSDIETDRDGQS